MKSLRLGLAALVFLLPASRPNSLELFISPQGSPKGSGTKEDPVSSLEAARDRLREIRMRSRLQRGTIHLWIREGTYARTTNFELGEMDSGSSESPLEIAPWQNESVLLVGGIMLKGFKSVTDPEVMSRLAPEARSSVLEAPIPAAPGGQTLDLSMKSRGFGRPLTRAHPELFANGKAMTLARWPNEGASLKIAGFPQNSGQGDEHGGNIGKLEGGFHYEGDRPSKWRDRTDIWVHGYWAWDWANSYEKIGSIDLEKHWIQTTPPHGLYGFRKDQRFHFLNILEELDSPGEWYLDKVRNKVLFWPPSAWNAGQTLLSVIETPIITLKNTSHVKITGLRIEAGRNHGVVIQGGASNIVESCAVRLMGNYGIWIEGGAGHRVTACEITDTGDGGVSISGGDRQTLKPGGHIVEQCHFKGQGRWSKCYVPAVLVEGVGHRISNNHIEEHPHCAILFTGNEHLIEFNEIHHVALETGDVGAIYTGRDWTYRGNRVLHNYIHHTGGVGMGSMGVYMDDCVSGTEIRGNIFEKVQRAAFLGGGRDHKVINNLFLDCKPAVQLDARGMDQKPVWHNMVFDFMKKQLEAVPTLLYRTRYPELATLDVHYLEGRGVPPEGNVVAKNVCIGGEWLSVGWHAKASDIDLKLNYVGKDPGFENLEKLDLRPKPGGAASVIGFETIPRSLIGPQPTKERNRLLEHVLSKNQP